MLPSKPANNIFSVVADGRLKGLGFPSVDEAERAGFGLFEIGHRSVVIIDRSTMATVKKLRPPQRPHHHPRHHR